MKCYHEKVIDEILQILKDNLILLYNYKEDSLINIRKFCFKKAHSRYKSLDYNMLIYFVEEALADLINTDFLYDFRDIE